MASLIARLCAALMLAAANDAQAAQPVVIEAGGQRDFQIESPKVTDLSGLTWVEGDRFYAVSNRTKAIFPLEIEINPSSGAIERVKIASEIAVKTRLEDFESIAWHAKQMRFFTSTERPSGVVKFDKNGRQAEEVKIPVIFQRARFNKSLESLAFGAGFFWIANEDTLTGDGKLSSLEAGGTVRIQKFNETFTPLQQFAYRTDRSLLRVAHSGTGLVDLCALPDGRLLALERVVALGLVARIYLVDFSGAADVMKIPRLAGATSRSARKKLLFERHTGIESFEGIALGPQLEKGWRSLLLISDSNGGASHVLMPLRIQTGATRDR